MLVGMGAFTVSDWSNFEDEPQGFPGRSAMLLPAAKQQIEALEAALRTSHLSLSVTVPLSRYTVFLFSKLAAVWRLLLVA